MRSQRTPAEKRQIQKMLMENRTFYTVFQDNWTEIVIDELKYRLYGKIPRNFLLNITGLIGTPTGIFKSSMGLQIALKLDPLFNLHQRVAFSINQLLDKIQQYSEYSFCSACFHDFKKDYKGTYEHHLESNESKCDNCENIAEHLILLTKLVFFLDEQTKSLKIGGLMRLQNLMDTVRQRQLCLITCGVDEYNMNFTTFHLQRIQESHDDFLPAKRVRYAVYDDKRDIYYGYFQWDITPLSDHQWNHFWADYSKMKTKFQRVAISQQIQSMNFEEFAQEIIESDEFLKCWRTTKKGNVLEIGILKNLIYKRYPDFTHLDREMILAEIKLMFKDNGNNNYDNDDEDLQMTI